MQLDQCPFYPSKSHEEQGHLKLLERREVIDPQALTGVTRGCPISFSFSSPFSLPFLQVTPVVGSPLAELPMPPPSSNDSSFNQSYMVF